MGREEERDYILKLVDEYSKKYLSNVETKKFEVGEKIPYSAKVFDEKEVVNLVSASLDFWLTQGRYYDEFEKKLSEYLNVKYVSYVNSGSSANLLAYAALTSPLLGDRQVKKGDEVITVACGFPTTIACIVQFGQIPVFVDMDIPTYNISVEELKKAITYKTKVIILAHTLGNAFDIRSIKKICDEKKIWLIEDNCDALGTEVLINGEWKKTGTIGDIGTSSFYPPHHLTTGEGGAVYTNNPLLNKIILSMRDWGRDCICKSGVDNTCNHRYDGSYGLLPKGYDHKYVYSHFGFNLKATDLQAAIGVAQIDKIDYFVKKRRENHKYLLDKLKELNVDKYLILQEALPDSKPSWFAMILTCRENVNRETVVRYIESKNIQTRMLFAGNMTKQPAFVDYYKNNDDYKIIGELVNTNKIMKDTFLVGIYPGLDRDRLDYIAKIISEAVKK